LRLSLHPDGLAPRIANLPEWRAHLLARLSRQVDSTADSGLAELLRELEHYPGLGSPGSDAANANQSLTSIAVPLRLQTEHGLLSFLSTTMVFGTPVDVTVSELAIEAFFPADTVTGDLLQRLTRTRPIVKEATNDGGNPRSSADALQEVTQMKVFVNLDPLWATRRYAR
jgi:hypothetical protein